MKALLCILSFLFLLTASGQELRLKIALTDSLPQETADALKDFEGRFADSLALLEQVGNVRNFLYTQGHLLSEAELVISDSTAQLLVDPGQVIYQSKIRLRYPEGFAIPRKSDRQKPGEILSPELLEEITSYHLSYLENHGYPFARLQIEDYAFRQDTLAATMAIMPGPPVRFDSIIIKGYNKFSRNVLRYDLSLEKGMLYDESLLRDLRDRTQQIEYLNMTRSPAVAFTKQQTLLYLYFEEVQGNQIDGVVGLNTEEDGDISLNGDFQLRLLNVLKRGEELQVRWRRPDANVQSLNLLTEIPYLVRTPVWLEGSLNIFRQDSSFVNSSFEGLLKYLLESGSFVSGGITYRSSNVLLDGPAPETVLGLNSFNTTFYKLGLEFRKTNRAIVPTKGFRLMAYGLTGNRNTSDTRQDQYGWEVAAARFLPFAERHVVKLGLQSEALFGNQLFRNELFRIGGLRTLRGFNEQSIFSSTYGIGTVEYRYMIGEYDYLTAFTDVAYVESKITDSETYNWFTGIGAGINFRTGAGIFSLFYAIGKDDQSPFDFRTSKVHFGYINRF